MSENSIQPLLERFYSLANKFEAAVKRGEVTEDWRAGKLAFTAL